jgi:hypothetical protein
MDPKLCRRSPTRQDDCIAAQVHHMALDALPEWKIEKALAIALGCCDFIWADRNGNNLGAVSLSCDELGRPLIVLDVGVQAFPTVSLGGIHIVRRLSARQQIR